MHIVKGIVIATNVAALVFATIVGLGVWAKTQGEELRLNMSTSLPRGLYISAKGEKIKRDSLIGFPMPEVMRPYVRSFGQAVETYHYDGNYVLIKKVVAMPGDTICRDETGRFTAAGLSIGTAMMIGENNARLPAWEGCRVLHETEVAVGSSRVNDSMDSRYFGPVRTADAVVYKAFAIE